MLPFLIDARLLRPAIAIMPRCRTDSEHSKQAVVANFRIRNFPQLKVAASHLRGKANDGI